MSKTVSKDDINQWIGVDLGSSDWIDVSQEMISQFATLTNDEQFIHVDEEKARHTPFGGTIAHGFLVLALLSHFASEVGIKIKESKMEVNYGFNKIRFINPVASGARIRGTFKLTSADEKGPGQLSLNYEVKVEIEGSDRPALLAEWLVFIAV